MPGLEHAFVKIPVVIGERNDVEVEIREGLQPGQRVVTNGAYALDSAGEGTVSLKAAMDAAHGHSHAEDGSELKEGEGNPSGEDDHDHAAGATGDPTLTWFFAALSGVLALLLVLSLVFRKQDNVA